MTRTKSIIILLLVIGSIISCSTNDNREAEFTIQPFIRFNLLVNSNDEPLRYPEVNSRRIPVSEFENTSLKPLKVPVTLTSPSPTEDVTATYSINSTDNIDDINFPTQKQLSFSGNQLTDTINISFNSRWENNPSFTLKLESISDPSIQIGNLNDDFDNETLKITLGDINTTYTLTENRIEIVGEQGEEIEFKVEFPNGFIPSEIENEPIFEFLDGFDYTLTRTGINDERTSINYKLTLNESINNDDVFYQTIITLVNTQNYSTVGNTVLQIVKPIKINRDLTVNTAANFYNLSDAFYRLFGEMWNDFNEDGICQWSFFFAFAKPVEVDAENPNAVLFDDMGTADPSDDIYHHAFQVGFRSNRLDLTTNSFNLKRYFNNESSSYANSPGFDVIPAIEFFPENGTSKTNGTILIIPQFLTIASNDGNSHSFGLSGEGTYTEISPGIFELKFELNLSNDEIFGGTLTSQYLMYNTRNYPDPEDINASCIIDYDL